jgi:adenosylcobinamide-phosphate synthase
MGMYEILLLAVAIDVLLGEPPLLCHPVAIMGHLITFGRSCCEGRKNQVFSGISLLICTVGITLLILGGILFLIHPFPYVVQVFCYAFLLKTTFSIRYLHSAAMAVQTPLLEKNVGTARKKVSELVSRDTSTLSEEKIVSAACESVAESLTDSIVAPLCWYLVFGLYGAFFYRAINTLDSMIGYEHLMIGTASARADDIVNFIPARISGSLILLSGAILGHDLKNGLNIFKRDRNNPESPNAGYTMAPVAGLLQVTFEKQGYYTLGDPIRQLVPSHIHQAVSIVEGATLIFVLLISFMDVII